MLAPLAVPDLPTGHRCRQETPRHIMCIRLGLHAGWPGVSASFFFFEERALGNRNPR